MSFTAPPGETVLHLPRQITQAEIRLCLAEVEAELVGISHGTVECVIVDGALDRVARRTTRKRLRS